ncbi:MAG: DUF4347 domain-containing protein, partial [Gammaproteobacteria bacterium]|nr:DUF4347 domain-containing protein [Gammaproteobacteria bacterium]
DSLTGQADILLYGCDVSDGAAGEFYIESLAGLTGADVAASEDITGAGGDWDLESSTGAIETQALEPDDVAAFSSALPIESLPPVTWDGGGTDSNWTTPENWGNDTLPGPSDLVQFGSNDVIVVDAVVSVGGLVMSGNAELTLLDSTGLTVNGDFEQSGTAVVDIPGGSSVVVNGTTTWAGNISLLNTTAPDPGDFNVYGDFSWLADGSSVTLDVSLVLLSHSIWVTDPEAGSAQISGTGTIQNHGLLQISHSAEIEIGNDFINDAFAIVEELNVTTSSDLIFDGAFFNAGRLIVGNGPNSPGGIVFSGSFGTDAFSGGSISGMGTVDLANAYDFGSESQQYFPMGVINPGTSPGDLRFLGGVDFAGATINIELSDNFDGDGDRFEPGEDYDVVAVEDPDGYGGGIATLGGTLDVSLLSGYSPAVGDIFTIMTADGIVGDFDAINLPDLSAYGQQATLVKTSSSIEVHVGAGPAPVAVDDPADLTRVSTDASGAEANGGIEGARNPETTDDGYLVVFQSQQIDLVSGDSNGFDDVFIKDVATGAIELISKTHDGQPANGASAYPHLDNTGRFVSFHSTADNLIDGGTTPGRSHIYLYDRLLDTLTLVSTDTAGAEASADSFHSRISGDGKWVFFHSDATDLISDDSNGIRDVFAYEVATGVITRLSVTANGDESSGSVEGSIRPVGSFDGRHVAYTNYSDDAVDDDSNGGHDIIVVDRDLDKDGIYDEFDEYGGVAVTRVSVDSDGNQGVGTDKGANRADISDDGRLVAFQSGYSNLVTGDTNDLRDVFVHDRDADGNGVFDETGTGERETVRVSVATGGGQATNNAGSSTEGSHRIAIANDGSAVVFESDTTGLTGTSVPTTRSPIYHHDLASGVTRIVSTTPDGFARGAADPVIVGDGSAAYFYSSAGDLTPGITNGMRDVFLWNEGGGVQTEIDRAVSINVLANDAFANPNTLSLSIVTQGGKGSAAVSGDRIVYTPTAGLSGSDSFTYQIDDGFGGTDTATVSVDIRNTGPHSIHLDNLSVVEGAANGTVVGELSTFDLEDDDQALFSYDLHTDATGGGFAISGRNLVVADGSKLDFETKAAVMVGVEVTDPDGNTHLQDFTIQVTDVIETNSYIGPPDPLEADIDNPGNWSQGRLPGTTDNIVSDRDLRFLGDPDFPLEFNEIVITDGADLAFYGKAVTANSLSTTGTFAGGATVLDLGGGVLDLGGTGTAMLFDTNLSGRGTIDGNVAVVGDTTARSVLIPRNFIPLHITGDLTLGNNTRYIRSLGDTGGYFMADGHVTLDGHLRVLAGTYTPVEGDVFDLFMAPSASGSFHTVELPDFSAYGLKAVLTGTGTSLQLEILDTTVVWDNEAGDNDWFNPLNWDGDALPTASDDVVVNDITGTLDISGGNAVFRTLTITGETLNVNNATLTGDSVVNEGQVSFKNSTLDADLDNRGTFTVPTSSTSQINGAITGNTGLIRIESGFQAGYGRLTVANGFSNAGEIEIIQQNYTSYTPVFTVSNGILT